MTYNIALERHKKSWRGELSGVHQLLVEAGAVSLLVENTCAAKRNKEVLLFTRKEADLEVNREYKHMLMSCHQITGQTNKIKTVNICTSYENELMLKTTINQNCIIEKIITRLSSGTICYYSIQDLLSSYTLFKDHNI